MIKPNSSINNPNQNIAVSNVRKAQSSSTAKPQAANITAADTRNKQPYEGIKLELSSKGQQKEQVKRMSMNELQKQVSDGIKKDKAITDMMSNARSQMMSQPADAILANANMTAETGVRLLG